MLRKFTKYWLRVWATWVLKKYRPRIVAITGSTGKTTAKDAIHIALSNPNRPGEVGKSQGNLNTEFGVPATIIDPNFTGQQVGDKAKLTFADLIRLKLRTGLLLITRQPYPKILILEMAADRPGDIGYFMEFIKPEVSVLTNIGDVHLEFFPDKASLVEEKGKLLAGVSQQGLAIINQDDEFANLMSKKTLANKVMISAKKEADFWASDLGISSSGLHFSVHHKGASQSITLPAYGQQFVYPGLIALAVADYFGISLNEAANRLQHFHPGKGRFERIDMGEMILIDDTYNANPTSTLAALTSLARISGGKRKVAILGDMRELGTAHDKGHKEVGQVAAQVADLLITVGQGGQLIQESALQFGLPPEQAKHIQPEAQDEVLALLRDNDIVLVKGSRAVHMDKIADLIKQGHSNVIPTKVEESPPPDPSSTSG